MTFAQPMFLFGLLALPLLWWLSQPPKPRRREFTAHMAQWQEALRALRRRPPRGSALRLVLLSLACIAATFAAAQPSLPGEPGAERLVVLLDASASMAATDDADVSAFDEGKQALRELLATVPAHVDVTVLRCGGELVRRHGASARALHDLGEPDGELRVDLVELAASIHDERTAVCTVTDGQGQSGLPRVGALRSIARQSDNAAIAGVHIGDGWPLPMLTVEVEVVAFTKQPVEVRLSCEGAVVAQQVDVQLESGRLATVPLTLQRLPAGGEMRLQIELPGDRLATDDVFRVQLPPLPAPRIAVLAEDNGGPFAAVAASALAAEVGGKVVPADKGGEVGLLLVDGGVAELQPGKVRALTFGSQLERGPAAEPQAVSAAIDWSRTSGLTRGLDLSELRIDRVWRDVLPAGEPFLWSVGEDAPVPLAVVAGDEIRSIHFAFRLQDGNLPLLAAFPQLLRRAFVHSYGQAARLTGETEPPPPSERNLQMAAAGEARELPGFAGQRRDLSRLAVVIGLLALALRAFVR